MLFFGKFYVTKKSKSVEIVLGISKAMSGSIAMKIRQHFAGMPIIADGRSVGVKTRESMLTSQMDGFL